MEDPQCPKCLSVTTVVAAATTTWHEWLCESCDLLFSTHDRAPTNREWAAMAQRQHRDHAHQLAPPATDTARALAARAQAIPRRHRERRTAP
jgi:hypothetical protein